MQAHISACITKRNQLPSYRDGRFPKMEQRTTGMHMQAIKHTYTHRHAHTRTDRQAPAHTPINARTSIPLTTHRAKADGLLLRVGALHAQGRALPPEVHMHRKQAIDLQRQARHVHLHTYAECARGRAYAHVHVRIHVVVQSHEAQHERPTASILRSTHACTHTHALSAEQCLTPMQHSSSP